ncbi:YggT family protein [Leuconostoc carnosum]|uniref:YggT family protein n=1 Tax=Leuconostoc carnosum TaxID=1252 RepID=UPI00123C1DC1|nr:YggT family protein [Leuconostoc carnosum]KAA8371154.1 YggT family protein [Leuconostoc carnosum]KAA8382794.1 YggT family protein [Leuconostoc carnosum]
MIEILSWILRIARYYEYAIVIYVLMSWLPGAQQSKLGQWIGRIVLPYLNLFRVIPPIGGMIDISPIIAILVLNFAVSGLSHLILLLF